MEYMMENVQSQPTSSIAWYNLAQLVSRGEKEKVLSIYRLLSHSFDSCAYRLQLEGDILSSFQDHNALEKYEESARLYARERRYASAVFLLEPLVTHEPENVSLRMRLVFCLMMLDWFSKWELHFEMLVSLLSKNSSDDQDVANFLEVCVNRLRPGVRDRQCKITLVKFLRFFEQRDAHLARKVKDLI